MINRMSLETEYADIIDAITRDHQLMRGEMGQLLSNDFSEAERRACLIRLMRTLRAQTAAEEQALLEILETNLSARERVYDAFEAHDLIESVLDRVENSLRSQPGWTEGLQGDAALLVSLIERHLGEEESELIPLARRCVTEIERRELKTKYAQIRRESLEEFEETNPMRPFGDASAKKEIVHA